MTVKRAIQDVLDRSPRLQALTPPKTREVVQWCRQRGYTPPDLESQRKKEDESIEDILTQIDNEPGVFVFIFGARLPFFCPAFSFLQPKVDQYFPFSAACVGVVLLLQISPVMLLMQLGSV